MFLVASGIIEYEALTLVGRKRRGEKEKKE